MSPKIDCKHSLIVVVGTTPYPSLHIAGKASSYLIHTSFKNLTLRSGNDVNNLSFYVHFPHRQLSKNRDRGFRRRGHIPEAAGDGRPRHLKPIACSFARGVEQIHFGARQLDRHANRLSF